MKAIDREEILRRYILSRGEEVGYYERYIPEADTSRDEASESEEEEDLEISPNDADRTNDLGMDMDDVDPQAGCVGVNLDENSACDDEENIPLARRKGYNFAENI